MEKTNLNILPTGGVLPIVHCSQGDIGRQFQINLYSDGVPYILDGTEELTIDGHKDDNNIFSYSLDPVTGSTITISTEEQMTACAGNVVCEIRIYKGDTRLGTCNFIIQVEEGPSNGIPSASTLQALDEIRAELQEAVEDAEAASEAASDYANTSKNWAVGPNGSGSGTDTNNSKYYSQQSANSATAASNSASAAHTSELNAAASESNAATSESNASISETNASNSATAASNSASAANTSANNASTSATTANNAKNDAISAKNDAITAKNAAEAAQQKIENMTASASQLPEGSSPTVNKSEVGGVVNLAFGIPKGDTGATGPRGADGLGVPAGGTTGQVLAKVSDTDNDTEWVDPSGGASWPMTYDKDLVLMEKSDWNSQIQDFEVTPYWGYPLYGSVSDTPGGYSDGATIGKIYNKQVYRMRTYDFITLYGSSDSIGPTTPSDTTLNIPAGLQSDNPTAMDALSRILEVQILVFDEVNGYVWNADGKDPNGNDSGIRYYFKTLHHGSSGHILVLYIKNDGTTYKKLKVNVLTMNYNAS